jgi:hypothetical protein
MINRSKFDVIAAVAAIGVTLPASAEYIRNIGALLLITARRLFDAHIQKNQMRLAPTRRLSVRPKRIC